MMTCGFLCPTYTSVPIMLDVSEVEIDLQIVSFGNVYMT